MADDNGNTASSCRAPIEAFGGEGLDVGVNDRSGMGRRHDARLRSRSQRSACCWLVFPFVCPRGIRLQKPRTGVWTELGRGPIIEVLLRSSVSVRVLGR